MDALYNKNIVTFAMIKKDLNEKSHPSQAALSNQSLSVLEQFDDAKIVKKNESCKLFRNYFGKSSQFYGNIWKFTGNFLSLQQITIIHSMGNQLPNNVFDRIGTVAVGIQQHFIDSGLTNSKNDRAIWNNISFVIAFLIEHKIISIVDKIYIELKLRQFYDDEDESFVCKIWISEGVTFYRKQIKELRDKTHPFPDVIVYNLLYPDLEKKSFMDMPIHDISLLAIFGCWDYIINVLNDFFLSDPNIKNLPRGC